jgi:hypothetical protein
MLMLEGRVVSSRAIKKRKIVVRYAREKETARKKETMKPGYLGRNRGDVGVRSCFWCYWCWLSCVMSSLTAPETLRRARLVVVN